MKKNLLSFIAVSVLLAFAASCSNNATLEDAEKATADGRDEAGATTFVMVENTDRALTRTSLDWPNRDFYWEKGDRIYVKDDLGVFRKFRNQNTGKHQPIFKFTESGAFAGNSYMVYYPGSKGHEDQVTIASVQTQKAPNNTEHFGAAGDCGMGIATRKDGQLTFDLDHKAAYLGFMPYTSHRLVSTYITKIEVTSDDNIAGEYELDPDDYELTGSGNQKTITLNFRGVGYDNGFPLSNNAPDINLNSAFVVIAPGVHKLTVKYYVKDIQTKVDGVITQDLGFFDYEEGGMYEFQSKLDVFDCDGKVYMWDAIRPYWYGYESEQPALNGVKSNNYPEDSSDLFLRWHNTVNPTGTKTAEASRSAKDCPNVNEMLWYAMKGDPHWDADRLWTTLGHLYKGGMWFKKAAAIAADNGGFSVESMKYSYGGKDYRKGTREMQNEFMEPSELRNWSIAQGAPENRSQYFYLPAFENYIDGMFRPGSERGIGNEGQYWTSTCWSKPSNPGTNGYGYGAFNLTFKKTHLGVHRSVRLAGMRSVAFE